MELFFIRLYELFKALENVCSRFMVKLTLLSMKRRVCNSSMEVVKIY